MNLENIIYSLFPKTLDYWYKKAWDIGYQNGHKIGYNEGRVKGYLQHIEECSQALKVSAVEFEEYVKWAGENL